MKQLDFIEHNYHEDDALIILEKYFDVWSKEDDWWCDNGEVDVNIWNDDEDRDIWHIFVCGLVNMDDGSYQTYTGLEIDAFKFKLGEL
tara:strand:+ start:570 stop:833 length:264 start_codon:yes stop_codon:yes gene_type:complete